MLMISKMVMRMQQSDEKNALRLSVNLASYYHTQRQPVILTQSCTHSIGVFSYPAYMAGLLRIPRAAITPECKGITNKTLHYREFITLIEQVLFPISNMSFLQIILNQEQESFTYTMEAA